MESPPPPKSGRQAGILVGGMFVAYWLNYCTRQSIFSIYPVLKSELHFSDAQLGLIGTVFSAIYGLASPLAGQIGDRYSRKALVLLSLVLWSFFTVLTGFAQSVLMLLIFRAFVGISESLFMPAALALTASAYPPHARARAVGILKSAQIFGVIAGGWFGGFMADRGHWRAAFFALGAAGILYAVPYQLSLKQYRQPIVAETRNSGSLIAVLEVVRIGSYLVLGVIFAVDGFGFWLLNAWLPSFLQDKFSIGMGEAALSAMLALQCGTLTGLIGGGWLSDRLSRLKPSSRFHSITLGLLLCVPCFHLIGHCGSLAETAVAAVGLGLGNGWIMANVIPASFDVVPADTRASAAGVLNLFSAVGAALGPWLGGLSRHTLGIENLLSLTGGAYAVAALLLFAGTGIWFRRDYARVH